MNLVMNELYNIANLKLDKKEDIEDVIQETMVKAYYNLSKLKNKSLFKTWIVKILINECNNKYKHKYKHNNIIKSLKSMNELKTLSGQKTLEEMFIDKESFNEFIAMFNEDEKLILHLYYTYGYNTNEIAKIMNKNINTLKSKLLRIKKKVEKYRKGGDNNNG